MQEHHILLGISKKQWNRYRRRCCGELGLPKSSSPLEIVAAIKAVTGWTSSKTADVLRRYYLRIRKKENKARRSVWFIGVQPQRHKPIGAPHPDYVKDEEFYTSRAWRELRLEALRNMRNCQACGRGPQHGIILHVDHIQPRYKAPHLALVLNNLQVLCEDCNIGKGAWDDTDFRHWRSI